MSDFSDRPFIAGSLTGLRTFGVDSLGRLVGPQYGVVFTPGENVAECRRTEAATVLVTAMQSAMQSEVLKINHHLYGPAVWHPSPRPLDLCKTYMREWRRLHPEPHVVAGLGCACGWYAYFDGRNDYRNARRIGALIEGYGVCTVGQRGFRAEKARIVALIRPKGSVRFDLVERNYPDVPVYDRKRDALAAHPLTVPEGPTPAEPDFWTRSAS